MLSVGERLAWAIDQKFGSTRKFQVRLKKAAPNLRGTSRMTLHRYLTGASVPAEGVLAAAATLLGVRLGWLESGEGAPTDQEEALRNSRPGLDIEAGELDRAAIDGLQSSMPEELGTHLTFEYRHLSAVAIKLARSRGARTASEYKKAGKDLAAWIGSAGVKFGFRSIPLSYPESGTVRAYVSAAATAAEIMIELVPRSRKEDSDG